MKKMILCITIVIANHAFSAIYYAAPAARGNGTSLNTPCTVASFLQRANAGDTLLLMDGRYTGNSGMINTISGRNGTSSAPITIMAMNDGKVLIDGEGVRVPVRVSAHNHHYILEGFNACNSSAGVVYSQTGTHHNIYRRIVAWDGGASSPHSSVWGLFGTDDNLIEDCAGWGSGRKIFGLGGHERGLVMRRCYFRWSGSASRNFKLGLTWTYFSQNTIAENCIGTWDAVPGSNERQTNAVFGVDNGHKTHGSKGEVVNWDGHRVLGCISYMTAAQENQGGTGAYALFWSKFFVSDFEMKDCLGYSEHNNVNPFVLMSTDGFGEDKGFVARNLTSIGGKGINNDGRNSGPARSGQVYDSIVMDSSTFGVGDFGYDYIDYDNILFCNNARGDFDVTEPTHYVNTDPGLTENYGNILQVGLSPNERPHVNGQPVGAQIQYCYENGVLTNIPLWPWPMNDRIRDAMIDSGYDTKGGLDGQGATDLTKVIFELGGGAMPGDFTELYENLDPNNVKKRR